MYNCSRSKSFCFQTKCFGRKCLWSDTVQNLREQIYIMLSFFAYQFNNILEVYQNYFATIVYNTRYFKCINIPLEMKQQILIFMIRQCICYNQRSIGIHEMLILDTVMIVRYVSNLCNITKLININILTGMIRFDSIVTCIQIVSISIKYNCLDKHIEIQTTNEHAASKFNQIPYMAIYTNPACVVTNQSTALLNIYNDVINLLPNDGDDT